ncbi:MAG: Crp/Fnr family transcriptional regulator, partial [Myxococcales bacterium]|nr:Crp/Fnr family transcriptional regulator [Myxococcales bacterium]
MAGSRSRQLRDKLQKALEKERYGEALGIYEALQTVEPSEPRWPHRKGDLLKRLGRKQAAVDSYETAVDLYAALGFLARAAAMAKVVLGVDPTRMDVMERVNLGPARKLHRSARRNVITAADHGIGDGEPVTQTKRIKRDALPLVRDESVPDGELRFTRPPMSTQRAMELDVSAEELGDRAKFKSGSLSERPTAHHLALLPSTPLFAEIPEAMLERLVRESRLVNLEDGESLVEKGTTADALYALVEGTVELRRTPDQSPVLLSEGDVVGISSLLDQASYGADVTARGRVCALRISKLLLDRLVAEHPPFGDVLLEVAGRRLVATLVRTSSLFAGFDDKGRSRIA